MGLYLLVRELLRWLAELFVVGLFTVGICAAIALVFWLMLEVF